MGWHTIERLLDLRQNLRQAQVSLTRERGQLDQAVCCLGQGVGRAWKRSDVTVTGMAPLPYPP